MQTRLEKYNKYRQEIYQFNKLVSENDSFQKQIQNYQKIINKINPQILVNWSDPKLDLFASPIDTSKAKQYLPSKIYENIRVIDRYQYEIVEKEKTKFFEFLENNYLFNNDHSKISQNFLLQQPSYKELMSLKDQKDSFEVNYKNNNLEKKLSENFDKSSEKTKLSITTMQPSSLKIKHKKTNYFFLITISLLLVIFFTLFACIILFALQII